MGIIFVSAKKFSLRLFCEPSQKNSAVAIFLCKKIAAAFFIYIKQKGDYKMKKRILSVFVAVVMLLSTVTVIAQDNRVPVTVYLSLSRYGEIVQDKNGNDMVYAPVTLSGKEQYTLDDAFISMHENYYESGTEGYESSEGEWGFGIDKLWGDTSYNFGYQVNGGTEWVSGLDHIVENGDHIEAVIYKNMYPDTEGYSKFGSSAVETNIGKPLKLTLFYVSGYDENWQSVFSPCEGATITVNGEETEYRTDENGEVAIEFEIIGEYVVSAKKEKTVNEEARPAITAPVCKVSVGEHEAVEIMHNIAHNFSNMDLEQTGGNLPWIVADMIVYEELFPESENAFSESKKRKALELIIDSAHNATTAGDLSKYSIALRALGYDAKKIYTEDFKKDDIISKLKELVDNNAEGVTNIYTLPYVLIALSQADEYATAEQKDYLVTTAVATKDQWQNTEFGTDALTPMLLALSPYYNIDEDIKNVIDEAVEILKSNQREDGLIDGFEGYESASTGLAICGLSALGIDSADVGNPDTSLIEGLLLTANENKDAFSNAFATEQGFRGLLAWQLLKNNSGKTMYDFSENSMDEANVWGAELCPVIFDVYPEKATVFGDGLREIYKNCFDVDEGTHSFKISANGYISETYTLEITAEEVLNRAPKKVSVSLLKKSGGVSSGGSAINKDKDKETEKAKDTQDKTEPTEPTAEKPIFDETTFADVKRENWYFDAVKYVYENNLFKGTGNGFEPDLPVTRAMLITVLHRLDNSPAALADISFSDVKDDAWYSQSVKWAVKNGIVNGISQSEFAPEDKISREQVATILHRFAAYKGYNTEAQTTEGEFNDYKSISSYALDAIDFMIANRILTGRENNILAPGDSITRAESAAMLMRFVEVIENAEK